MSPENNPDKITTLEKRKEDIFASLFKTGTIAQIKREEIPETILKFFEGMSGRFIHPKKYIEGNFIAYYIINHVDIPGLVTYVADQNKIYDNGENKLEIVERNIYFYEEFEGEKVGHGELRYQPNTKKLYFKDRPFVGFTRTEEGLLQMGFGTKRILEMGAYSEMEFKLPLYSGDQNKEADNVWQKLIQEGKAKEAPTDNHLRKRYKLILT